MKPEPLTEKKMKCLVSDGNISFEPAFKKDIGKITVLFDYKDVKSAVEWLLKEIEKEWGKVFVEMHGYDSESCSYWLCLGEWKGFKIAKDLIKKVFSEVVEE